MTHTNTELKHTQTAHQHTGRDSNTQRMRQTHSKRMRDIQTQSETHRHKSVCLTHSENERVTVTPTPTGCSPTRGGAAAERAPVGPVLRVQLQPRPVSFVVAPPPAQRPPASPRAVPAQPVPSHLHELVLVEAQVLRPPRQAHVAGLHGEEGAAIPPARFCPTHRPRRPRQAQPHLRR